MSTVKVQLKDGSFHDFEIKYLTPETIFSLVQKGEIDFKDFDEWRRQTYMEGYQDGLDQNSDRGEDD
jgi:hypothetical protein